MTSIDEQFLAHSRLVRPFNTGRLQTVLHQVLASAETIRASSQRLATDPPRDAEHYVTALNEIGMALETLADACDEACPEIARLIEMAPGEHRRAISGLVAMIRGLQAVVGASDAPLAA